MSGGGDEGGKVSDVEIDRRGPVIKRSGMGIKVSGKEHISVGSSSSDVISEQGPTLSAH